MSRRGEKERHVEDILDPWPGDEYLLNSSQKSASGQPRWHGLRGGAQRSDKPSRFL